MKRFKLALILQRAEYTTRLDVSSWFVCALKYLDSERASFRVPSAGIKFIAWSNVVVKSLYYNLFALIRSLRHTRHFMRPLSPGMTAL